MNDCIWIPQNDSHGAWFIAQDHPKEDMRPRSDVSTWEFCPHCGRPLVVTTFDGGSEHG